MTDIAAGFGIDFSKIDKELKAADKRLEVFAESAEKQMKRVRDAFELSGAKGLKQLQAELTNTYSKMSKLAEKHKIEFRPSIDGTASQKVIDDINTIVNLTRQKFEELNSFKFAGILDTKKYNDIEKLADRLATLQNALSTGRWQEGDIDAPLTNKQRVTIADEIEAIKERLNVLRMSTAEFQEIKSKEIQKVISNAQIEADLAQKKKKEYDEEIAKLKELEKEKARIESQNRANAYARTQRSGDTSGQALAAYNRLYSDKGVMSIQRMNEALSKMRSAQEKLNLNTEQGRKKYEELDKAIKRVEQDLNKATNSSKRLTTEHNALLEVGKKLSTRFAQLFSVQAIVGYANQVIKIRGEFELQHRAMQNLVGDVDEANKIWDKTVSLAVKSPFKVRDLVTYTKQLSAYRIETDKLYEKTRMLADISSGLGVDMNRLILAYGQVKAANYLRGTELRQFSEAGINILGELAKYFSELEGRAISVGDVFERVSKRLVSFSDVDEVLQRVTGESGAFYQMQEKQSQTLKGMMLNLTDTIELMMNDLGKRNDSILKGSISMLKNLIDNWRQLEPVISAAGIALITYFPVKVITKIGKALAEIPAIFAKNPYAIAIAGVAALATVIYKAATAQSKLNAAMSEIDTNITQSLEESISLYHDLSEAITDVTKSSEERNKAYDKLKTKFADILPDQMTERSYIEALSGDYKEAEAAMMSYYNAKALQQKKDKVNSMYEEALDKETGELKGSYKRYIKDWFDEGKITEEQKVKLEAGINGAITKAIESAKNGDIASTSDALRKEVEKNLGDFAGMKSTPVTAHWTGTYLKNLSEISDAIRNYKKDMADVKGLQFETYDEMVAAEEKERLNKQFDFIKDKYSKLANIYKNVAKEGSVSQDLSKDIDLILNEVKKKYPHFTKLLENLNRDLLDSALQGTYEFEKALPIIESSMYTMDGGFSFFAKETAKAAEITGKDASRTLFDAFAKELKGNGEKLLRGTLQNSIINAIDYVIDQHGLDGETKDLMSKLIPDSSKSTADVRQQIEGILKNYEELEKSYKIALKAGAEELPFVDWITKSGAEETSRSVDAYLGGTAEILARNKELILVMKQLYQLLGGELNGTSSAEEMFPKKLSAIKELYKAYKELLKTSNELQSKSGAWEKVGDAWMEAFDGTPEQMGFTNFFSEEGVTEAFDWLVNNAPDAAKRIQAQLAKSEFILEGEVRLRQEDQEKVRNEIEDMLGSYEVTMEMEKLQIPPELAQRLFDFNPTSLDGIREKVQAEIDKIKVTKGQEDQLEALEEFLSQIDDLQNEAIEREMNEFVRFLRKSGDEISNAYRKSGIYMNTAKKLFDEGKISAEEYGDAIRRIVKETNESVSKVRLEEFKNSPLYIAAMGTAAIKTKKEIKSLINDIKNLYEANKNAMSPEEAEEYAKAINKLREQQNKIKPGFFYSESVEKIKQIVSLEKELTAEKEKQEKLERERANKELRLESLNSLLESLKEGLQTENTAAEIQNVMNQIQQTNDELHTTNNELVLTSQNIEGLESSMQGVTEGATAAIAIIDIIIKETHKLIIESSKIFNDLKDVFESYGVDTESGGWAKASSVFETIGSVSTEVYQGWENFQNGNIIGGIANTVGAVTKLIKGINEYIDIDKTEEVEKQTEKAEEQAKAVEKLERQYRKLEDAMESAYSVEQLNATKASMEQNIDEQRNAIDAQIAALEQANAAEASKKDADQEAIDARKEEIEELREQQEDLLEQEEELHKQFIETLGGGTDYASVAEEFLDAWLTAFEETGDGLSGLEDAFEEYWKNILKKQVLYGGASEIMRGYMDEINKALDDGVIDSSEENAIDKIEEDTKKKLDEFYAWANDKYDLSKMKDGELSGLQAGIQGITEEQADILEAYWNEVRFDISAIRRQIEQYFSTDSASENPMLAYIKSTSETVGLIHTLIKDINATSAVNGSSGFRVYVNNWEDR